MSDRSRSCAPLRERTTTLARLADREALARGQPIWVHVHGTSMWPLIVPGDRVRLLPVRSGSPRPGEIVACEIGPAVLLHRLISIRAHKDPGQARWIRCRGDTRLRADPWCKEPAIMGVASDVERRGHVFPLASPPYRLAGDVARLTHPASAVLLRVVAHLWHRLRRPQRAPHGAARHT